jgi:DNA alkylation repair enzyme
MQSSLITSTAYKEGFEMKKPGPKKAAKSKGRQVADGSTEFSAKQFIERLKKLSSQTEAQKSQRYFKTDKGQYGEGDVFIGVRMGQIFALAKEFIEMAPSEIEKLLESPIHEVRAGAVSIMDWQARHKKTPDARRKELYDLYLRRHDRINNWDLVDRSAPYVVGGYLSDKPRDVLYKLARSKNMWERRTAIVSTYYFVRQGDVADTFRIAEMLLSDNEDLIHKATGGWLREAGKKDRKMLLRFLDKYAATMPRTALRYAIEHFDKKQREHYLSLKKAGETK